MKTWFKFILLAAALAAPGRLLAGFYSSDVANHGHTGDGDGGQLTTLSLPDNISSSGTVTGSSVTARFLLSAKTLVVTDSITSSTGSVNAASATLSGLLTWASASGSSLSVSSLTVASSMTVNAPSVTVNASTWQFTGASLLVNVGTNTLPTAILEVSLDSSRATSLENLAIVDYTSQNTGVVSFKSGDSTEEYQVGNNYNGGTQEFAIQGFNMTNSHVQFYDSVGPVQVSTNIAASVAPKQSAIYSSGIVKAWAYLNGTGTPAISDGLNFGSVTDNGTGDYSLNFVRAMANTTYAAVCSATDLVCMTADQSTTLVRIRTADFAGTLTDTARILVHVVGDN